MDIAALGSTAPPTLVASQHAQDYLLAIAFMGEPSLNPGAFHGSIDRALTALADLPFREGWQPVAGVKGVTDHLAVTLAYSQGVAACSLVVDTATGTREFTDPWRWPQEVPAPGLGMLLRVVDTLDSARGVYRYLADPELPGTFPQDYAVAIEPFAPGHGVVLDNLREAAKAAARKASALPGSDTGTAG